jgi:DNA-binding MarR family transcriptional regulator
MADSPVGVAAWILEKFGAWADVPRDDTGQPDLWQAFDEDLLLTNIMRYLVETSFVTSTWMYRGRLLEGSASFPAGAFMKVPTGVAAFPDPLFSPPPRSHVRKTYNIVHWTQMPAGGHFAALEQPELLLAARQEPVQANVLQAALGVDRGYLSRMIARFEDRGWITRDRLEADARTRPIHLTEEGRAAFDQIDQRQRSAVAHDLPV